MRLELKSLHEWIDYLETLATEVDQEMEGIIGTKLKHLMMNLRRRKDGLGLPETTIGEVTILGYKAENSLISRKIRSRSLFGMGRKIKMIFECNTYTEKR